MTGAQTATGVAVKVFVKQDQIAPVRIGDESHIVTEGRHLSVPVPQKQRRQTRGQFTRDLFQVQYTA